MERIRMQDAHSVLCDRNCKQAAQAPSGKSLLQPGKAGLPCPVGLSALSPGTLLMVRICSATLICLWF